VAQRISDTLHVQDIVILVRDGAVYKTRYSTRMGEPMDIPATSHLLAAPGEQDAPLQVYFDQPQPWIRSLNAEELQTLDFMRSELLLALRGRGNQGGQIIGIMSLGPKKSQEPYSKTDIRLLQAIAVQMGWALENSRLAASLADEAAHREVMNRELEIAREVQERLFPQKFPRITGVDCWGYCRPARGVGGDYYDFIELPDGRLGIAIGDVSGKGIAAALLMASLQASLRGQTMAGVGDLATLMLNVNKLVYDASQSNRYATFFYAEFDPKTLLLSYVNAGHNAPMILRGADALRLEACGPVVGLLPAVSYDMDSCQLQAGDIFVGYTDGISEAMNEQDEEWEEDRFIAAARAVAHDGSKPMIEGIFRRADAFTGAAKQYDDMTLLVIKLAA
jgi:sigma-B regulation protein RsbU (phosphoserine phosphatase)